jgi:hypothetical protein
MPHTIVAEGREHNLVGDVERSDHTMGTPQIAAGWTEREREREEREGGTDARRSERGEERRGGTDGGDRGRESEGGTDARRRERGGERG